MRPTKLEYSLHIKIYIKKKLVAKPHPSRMQKSHQILIVSPK
jgi:hypothetical protein